MTSDLATRIVGGRSFDSFLDTPETRTALAAARRWAARPTGPLVLCGPPGSGRRHLAAAAVREVVAGGPPVRRLTLDWTIPRVSPIRPEDRPIRLPIDRYPGLDQLGGGVDEIDILTIARVDRADGDPDVAKRTAAAIDKVVRRGGAVALTAQEQPNAEVVRRLGRGVRAEVVATAPPWPETRARIVRAMFATYPGDIQPEAIDHLVPRIAPLMEHAWSIVRHVAGTTLLVGEPLTVETAQRSFDTWTGFAPWVEEPWSVGAPEASLELGFVALWYPPDVLPVRRMPHEGSDGWDDLADLAWLLRNGTDLSYPRLGMLFDLDSTIVMQLVRHGEQRRASGVSRPVSRADAIRAALAVGAPPTPPTVEMIPFP